MKSLKDAGRYLSLADAIQTLKVELLRAESIAIEDRTALLQLEACEIELSLEFTPKAGVGFDIWVFKAEVGAEASGGHKITVKYKPTRVIVAAALSDTAQEDEVVLPAKRPARKTAKGRS